MIGHHRKSVKEFGKHTRILMTGYILKERNIWIGIKILHEVFIGETLARIRPSRWATAACKVGGQRRAEGWVQSDNFSPNHQYPSLITTSSLIANHPPLSIWCAPFPRWRLFPYGVCPQIAASSLTLCSSIINRSSPTPAGAYIQLASGVAEFAKEWFSGLIIA